MTNESKTRDCPYCKEEIKVDAIKCKHCHSMLEPSRPSHEGICPFCKEKVKPDAIKCKHCGASIGHRAKLHGCSNAGDKLTTRPSLLSRRFYDLGQECWIRCMSMCPMGENWCHGYCEDLCQVCIPRWGSVAPVKTYWDK